MPKGVYERTEEIKQRLRELNKLFAFKKGNKFRFKKGQTSWNKGKKFSDETKRKMSKVQKGNTNCLGRILSDETKIKIGLGNKGDNSGRWKGGRRKTIGYIQILKPEHPFANIKGYILEHRLVMEKYLGRYLKPKEVIHHVNNIRDDNRIENLMLFTNKGEHTKYHKELKIA